MYFAKQADTFLSSGKKAISLLVETISLSKADHRSVVLYLLTEKDGEICGESVCAIFQVLLTTWLRNRGCENEIQIVVAPPNFLISTEDSPFLSGTRKNKHPSQKMPSWHLSYLALCMSMGFCFLPSGFYEASSIPQFYILCHRSLFFSQNLAVKTLYLYVLLQKHCSSTTCFL